MSLDIFFLMSIACAESTPDPVDRGGRKAGGDGVEDGYRSAAKQTLSAYRCTGGVSRVFSTSIALYYYISLGILHLLCLRVESQRRRKYFGMYLRDLGPSDAARRLPSNGAGRVVTKRASSESTYVPPQTRLFLLPISLKDYNTS